MMRTACPAVMSAVFAFSSTTIPAASDCKVLEETACAGNPACTWTKGYTRSDGKAVAAYCKAKAGNKAGAETAATPAPASATEGTTK